jgi:hypothetical protein
MLELDDEQQYGLAQLLEADDTDGFNAGSGGEWSECRSSGHRSSVLV